MGLLSSVKPITDLLSQHGIYFARPLIQQFLRAEGE
jgi:hypothetical protein